jgi:hypothetical protein
MDTFEAIYNEVLMNLARNTPSWTKFPPKDQSYVSFISGGECAGKRTILKDKVIFIIWSTLVVV